MGFLKHYLEYRFPRQNASHAEKRNGFMPGLPGSCPPAERESADWIFPIYDYRHPAIKKSLMAFQIQGQKKIGGDFRGNYLRQNFGRTG